MRVHEIHPALAHFPIALVPTAVGADLAGSLLEDPLLHVVGRKLMPLALLSMAATGLAGFMAQSAVKTDDEATDVLITHLDLNIALLALTTVLTGVRLRSERTSAGYLLAGHRAVALATYTGYLGGKMVYTHGVAVKAHEGFDAARSPDIFEDDPRRSVRVAVEDGVEGVKLTAEELMEGKIAPSLAK